MSCSKSNGTGLSALTNPTPRSPVINRRHTAIQVKSRTKSKPENLAGSAIRRATTSLPRLSLTAYRCRLSTAALPHRFLRFVERLFGFFVECYLRRRLAHLQLVAHLLDLR